MWPPHNAPSTCCLVSPTCSLYFAYFLINILMSVNAPKIFHLLLNFPSGSLIIISFPKTSLFCLLSPSLNAAYSPLNKRFCNLQKMNTVEGTCALIKWTSTTIKRKKSSQYEEYFIHWICFQTMLNFWICFQTMLNYDMSQLNVCSY